MQEAVIVIKYPTRLVVGRVAVKAGDTGSPQMGEFAPPQRQRGPLLRFVQFTIRVAHVVRPQRDSRCGNRRLTDPGHRTRRVGIARI